MDFLDFMGVFGFLVTMFFIYRALCGKRIETKGHYTKQAWNFFLKKLFVQYRLNQKQKKDSVKIEQKLTELEHEHMKKVPTEDSSDSQLFFANDESGNSLLLKFIRLRHQVAEVWLILRLKNGQVFTLPEHPNTKIVNATPRTFEGSGLNMECLVAFTKWRITFSGMLRQRLEGDAENDEKLFYVRMDFVWDHNSIPTNISCDSSSKLLATALATEKWRDGKWMQLIDQKKNSGGNNQFGMCKGEVTVYSKDLMPYLDGSLPSVETFELNLHGLKQRRWGPSLDENLHRYCVFMGNTKDGFSFEIGALSRKTGLTHLQFGNVRFPDSHVHLVDWTDFNLEFLGENPNNLPEVTTVKMKAGGKSFVVDINFKNNEKVQLHSGSRTNAWIAFVVPIEFKFNLKVGSGCAIFWYPNNILSFNFIESRNKNLMSFDRESAQKSLKLLLTYDDEEAKNVMLSGKDGLLFATLSTLQHSDEHSLEPDFKLYQGFIISSIAQKWFLRFNPQIQSLLLQLKTSGKNCGNEDLIGICLKIQKAFMSSRLDSFLRAIILQKLNILGVDGSAVFTVRSSGVPNEGEEKAHSFDEQSFKELRENSEVFKAIIKCWASLYTFQKVISRFKNGLPVDSMTAIIVQKTEKNRVGGLLLTRCRANGDPRLMTVQIALQPEKEDSALVKFLVKKSYSGSLTFLGINPRRLSDYFNEGDTNICLFKQTVLKIAKIGVKVENFFGNPFDIEFAVIDDQNIYLVELRPTIKAFDKPSEDKID